jgi:hypothetical protein
MIEPEKAAKEYSPAVMDAHRMMQCSDKRSLYALTKDWDAERRKASLKLLFSDEERQRLKELTNSFIYNVGDLVVHNDEQFTIIARPAKPTLRDVVYTVQDTSGTEYSLEEMLIDGLADTINQVTNNGAKDVEHEEEF